MPSILASAAAAQIVEASAMVNVLNVAWQPSARAAVAAEILLLTIDLIVEAIDHIVSEQVLRVVMVVVVVSDQLLINVVHIVISVVYNGLINKNIIAILHTLLTVSVLTVD